MISQSFPLSLTDQISILSSKYDTLLNAIKQINLVIQYFIKTRNSEPENSMKSMVNELDQYIIEYNILLTTLKFKNQMYFMVNPLMFEPAYMNQVRMIDYSQNKQLQYDNKKMMALNVQNASFVVKFVFCKDDRDKYDIKHRMHLEIWKKHETSVETNQLLNLFENQFQQDLLEKLYQEGFVAHFCTNLAVYLNPSVSQVQKIPYRCNRRYGSTKATLEEFLKKFGKRILNILTNVFKTELVCAKCNNGIIYNAFRGQMIPITVRVYSNRDSEGFHILHQICAIYYLSRVQDPQPEGKKDEFDE